MTLTHTPTTNRVLVRVSDTKESERPSGLVIVEQQKEKPNSGTVISIGTEDGSETGFGLTPGDTVIYARYGGHEITLNEVQHVVLDVKDILLIERDQ